MTSPTPMPDEFPDDNERLHQGIEEELKRAAEAQPAPGSQAAGDSWGQFDPALRDLKPSCGAIYMNGSGTFVVCSLEQGHEDETCRGEGFQWKSATALVRPGQPAAATDEAPTQPEPAEEAPPTHVAPEMGVPLPREDADVLAQLYSNRDTRYRVNVYMGPFRINPNRIDPLLLNDVDRTMVAAMLRHAAERIDPETGPVACDCDCEERLG